jgi:ribosomal protein S18
LEYEVKSLEESFVNIDGNTVKPDLIIASKRGYLIIFEAKSGKNAEKHQLENYSNIKNTDLINNAGFKRIYFKKGFDISYICYKNTYIENEKTSAFENLIKSIDGYYRFAVLKYDKEEGFLSLELNKFKDNKINNLSKNIIKIPKNRIPRFISFDQHSAVKELIPVAVQNIISYILEEKLEFTLEELTNDSLSPYPGIEDLIGSETKKAVKNKLKEVMRKLREKKPEYFSWKNKQKYWEINDSLSDPNYNQLNALRNLINDKTKIADGQMSIFDN